MSAISTWSTTAASNNSAAPDGWPENMAFSGVNDCGREMMSALRTWYQDAEWIKWGDTTTYVAATQFKISGSDVTARYSVGRRVRVVGSSTGTIYGKITVSSFATDTTVTVSFDSGSLSNETLTVSIASIKGGTSAQSIDVTGVKNAADTTAANTFSATNTFSGLLNSTGTATFAGITNTGLNILDTNASHTLGIVPGSDLTANRVLTITTGDAARTITLSGNPTLGGVNLTANAAQADMETGTSTTVAVVPGVMQYHPGVAKAWVNFNGTGTVAIRVSYNTSSITDNATADYTVNFTTAFSTADYVITGCGSPNYSGGRPGGIIALFSQVSGTEAAPSVSSFRFSIFGDEGVAYDAKYITLAVYGDQ